MRKQKHSNQDESYHSYCELVNGLHLPESWRNGKTQHPNKNGDYDGPSYDGTNNPL